MLLDNFFLFNLIFVDGFLLSRSSNSIILSSAPIYFFSTLIYISGKFGFSYSITCFSFLNSSICLSNFLFATTYFMCWTATLAALWWSEVKWLVGSYLMLYLIDFMTFSFTSLTALILWAAYWNWSLFKSFWISAFIYSSALRFTST